MPVAAERPPVNATTFSMPGFLRTMATICYNFLLMSWNEID